MSIKRVFYALCIIMIPCIISLLVYQRRNDETRGDTQNAQTIIPVEQSAYSGIERESEDDNAEKVEPFITLAGDETAIKLITVDINNDDMADRLVAVKKISDPYVALVLFLYDDETQSFIRTEEIRTTISQPNTLTLYVLPVQNFTAPVILYYGINTENLQVFAMHSVEIRHKKQIAVHTITQLRADGQILFTKNDNRQNSGLSAYSIKTYHTDTQYPNTLNQIEKIYTWNEKSAAFTQSGEEKIPGKAVETAFLKKIQNGSTGVFKEFLAGLWYQPFSNEQQHRSIFFNIAESELIFSINNIEEIFTVQSITSRKYGMYFTTKNAAITSIHRRVDIELISVDEIRVRVIEDVARLKIGASSNWDGVYRKIHTTIAPSSDSVNTAAIKEQLYADGKKWIGTDGSELSFSDNGYTLIRAETAVSDNPETGWYALMTVKQQCILQLKDAAQKDRFFIVTFDSGQNEKLLLTQVYVSITELVLAGTPPLSFEKEHSL